MLKEKPISQAIADLHHLYARTDKERFPCSHEVDRPSTLFYADFKVAEYFGMNSVRATMEGVHFDTRDPKDLTELCMVLNHLVWEIYGKKSRTNYDNELFDYYMSFYNKIMEMSNNWSKENQEHFFLVTD